MKRLMWTLGIGFVLVIGFACAFLFSGTFDVSAAKPEGSLAQWVFSTMMDNSVRRSAETVTVPSLDDSALIRLGFAHYSDMCVSCHGSPAGGRTEVGLGLNPPAPDLSSVVNDWKPSELYWIIKNGIKMTGMPAFGPTHNENELWGMVAFVRKLPGMTAEQYKAFSIQTASSEESQMQGMNNSEHEH